MRTLSMFCILGVLLGAAGRLAAQDPAAKTRTWCDVNDAKNNCPNGQIEGKCVCSLDTLEVTFDRDGLTDSVFGYDTFTANTPVDTTIASEVKSGVKDQSGVQGWSYGVDHDDAFLTLSAVTIDGTDAAVAKNGGFAVADMTKIETCRGEAPPACKSPQPGTGYITAVILSLQLPVFLEPGRRSLVKGAYTLTADPGTTGTLVEITDRLKKMNSPPTDINITVDGISKSPVTIVDGFVVKLGGCVPSGNEDLATGNSCTDTLDNDCDGAIDAADSGCTAPPTEICNNTTDDDGDGAIDCADTDCAGDPACPGTEICNNTTDDDGDGAIDCADSDCTGDPACPAPPCKDYAYYFGPAATDQNLAVAAGSEYVITMRNLAASLGFQLGVKATTAGNSTTWEFSGALGADANRLIELIVTDDQGNSKTPEAGNKATSDQSTVSDVVRGAATAGFSNGDFLGIDLAPGVGGPGFTVGYVTELNPQGGQTDKIPATGAGTPCPVNEILKVQLGVVAPGKFSRGDANGDSKINVTDAVLIIQIVVGNIQAKFDCQDALDANDDGQVNVADAVPVLSYVFQRGPDLPEPFKKCAADPTNDALTCTQANCQ